MAEKTEEPNCPDAGGASSAITKLVDEGMLLWDKSVIDYIKWERNFNIMLKYRGNMGT